MGNMTKKGARSVTRMQDRLAALYQQEWETLGIPEHIAMDAARRNDMLSDAIEKKAGIEKSALDELDVVKEKGFDPEEIGEEVAGPQEGDADESYMKGHFTQQVNRELRERQEDGDLGMTPVEEIQPPQPGKQASFEQIGRLEANNRLGMAVQRIQGAAVRLASAGHKDLSTAVARLAASFMATQVGVLNDTVSAAQATRTLQVANHLLPSLESVTPEMVAKVATMVDFAQKAAGEVPEAFKKQWDKGEDKKDEEKKEDKKAGEVPEAFKKQWDKNKGEDKGEDKKDEDKKDEDKDDKKPDFVKKIEEGKKASHGFNLNA